MSALCRFQEDMHNLRHIQRQMRLLDARLHLLRDRLSACRLHRLGHHHCCTHLSDCHHHCTHLSDCHHHCVGRRALVARLDLERRLNRLRRLGMLLSTCHAHNPCHLPCDPCDPCVSVCVKNGKVTWSSEHMEEHDTVLGKVCNYRKCIKEFCPGDEEEVTYSVESTKVEAVPKCCPHPCDF